MDDRTLPSVFVVGGLTVSMAKNLNATVVPHVAVSGHRRVGVDVDAAGSPGQCLTG